MAARVIRKNIYAVGAPDWDRRLFDELIPLPDGTTYNSYLIKGSEKNALIDTVDPVKKNILIENLNQLGIAHLDYIITNHTEQDHSGALNDIIGIYPMAKIVTNAKCIDLTMNHLLIAKDKFIEIKDGDRLSLGDQNLEFIIAPWVHWPETMLTYLVEDKILFSCDLFGAHLAGSDLFASDERQLYFTAKRYYAEIMMPFRKNIQNHMKRLESYRIDVIAPSHGPVHQRPAFILDAYRDWISDDVKNEVVLPYVSMHGSVEKMVGHFIEVLMQNGISVKPHNLSKTDIGELAMSLVDAATLVIGTPTVLTGPHPLAVYAVYLANALRPKTRFVSIIGSYGWGGKMPETIAAMIGNLKVEIIAPVIARGQPRSDDFKAIEALAGSIAAKHKAAGII